MRYSVQAVRTLEFYCAPCVGSRPSIARRECDFPLSLRGSSPEVAAPCFVALRRTLLPIEQQRFPRASTRTLAKLVNSTRCSACPASFQWPVQERASLNFRVRGHSPANHGLRVARRVPLRCEIFHVAV